jgi:hypothetical protein
LEKPLPFRTKREHLVRNDRCFLSIYLLHVLFAGDYFAVGNTRLVCNIILSICNFYIKRLINAFSRDSLLDKKISHYYKDKLEIHYTPKQGGWLNMAEIELSVINNQGLPARIGTPEEMRRRVGAGNKVRNGKGGKNKRRFTTAGTRIKLKRLYPQFDSWLPLVYT